MKKTLLQKTIDLMRVSDSSVTQVCRECGVTRDWYYKLLRGEIDDPGVNRVEKIHEYLKRDRRRFAKSA